jgi:ribosome biogenesis GTPase / thiamine phosphate phosphatase
LNLSALGWDDSWATAITPYPGTTPGRIIRVDRGRCTVRTASGDISSDYRETLPGVGDWVALRASADLWRIEAILPRRTAFIRAGVARDTHGGGLSGDSTGQVLAANVDVAFVVEPAALTDLGRIERLLALAWESGAQPHVLITKADLAADLPALLAEVEATAPGVGVHAVSALTEEGVDTLRALATGTSVLLGPSGAGKSTIVNLLAGAPVMVTQAIRAADGRGRHTTTHRELIELPAGLIIDTPGLRRVGLYDIGSGLSLAFADIEELAGECRFADCAHDREPGCAVHEAVAAGDLPERRLAAWHKLRREAEWMASRTDARLRAERTRRWKNLHTEMRRSGRSRP